MHEITVTRTPLNVRAALGLADATNSTLFLGRAQNRGPATVYRASGTAPDPAAVRGFRHASGDTFQILISSDDLGATWVWTSGGTATLVLESGGVLA